MKDLFKSFVSFTRTERRGFISLMILLLVLVIIRCTMHLWVKPTTDEARQQQLVAAWRTFKEKVAAEPKPTHTVASDTQKATTSGNIKRATYAETNHYQKTNPIAGKLFPFDPNTLDSAGFRQLGLREKTTAILLHWRAKGKIFRKKEDLKGVYTLQPDEYQRLEPYIKIKD